MTARTAVVAAAAAVLLTAGCSTAEHGPGHPAATSPAPLGTSSPADEPEAAPTLLPGIPDSAELDEPVAARGRVVRPDGTAVADALVTLATWPADAQPATTDPGDGYPLTPVAAARTGADGGYELRIPAELREALPTNEDGQVEFGLFAESSEGDGQLPFWTAPAELTHPHTADIEITP